MKFMQIRKRKMKFPPGTGLRGQPAAVVAHADAQPRQGGDVHVATDGVGGDPASRARACAPSQAAQALFFLCCFLFC